MVSWTDAEAIATVPLGGRPITEMTGVEEDWGERLPLHRSSLLRTARRLARDDAEAQDLVQDVYVRALSRTQSLQPGSDLKGWLTTILVNRFVDLCRFRRTRARTGSLHEIEERYPAPEPQPPPRWAQVDDETLAAAIEGLPPDMRTVYRLHAVEELDYAAIAERLGIPRNTVGTRLLRARRRLREMLEERIA